jgi:hypothetical protein
VLECSVLATSLTLLLRHFLLAKELANYSENLLVLVMLKPLRSRISVGLLDASTISAFTLIAMMHRGKCLETVRKRVERFLRFTISL